MAVKMNETEEQIDRVEFLRRGGAVFYEDEMVYVSDCDRSRIPDRIELCVGDVIRYNDYLFTVLKMWRMYDDVRALVLIYDAAAVYDVYSMARLAVMKCIARKI